MKHRRNATVVHESGLHLRIATKITGLANHYECLIEVVKDGEVADAKSTMSLLALGASQGTLLEVRGQGPGSVDAVRAVVQMLEDETTS